MSQSSLIPSDLTPIESSYLKDAEHTANQIWENRYQHMRNLDHDPETAAYLATFGERVDSAVMVTETDVIEAAVNFINTLRQADQLNNNTGETKG